MATQKKPAGALLRDTYSADSIFSALSGMQDPDMILEKAGIERHQLKMLEYDDEISGALETRREAVTSMPWRLESIAGGDGEPEDAPTLFVREQIECVIGDILRGAWAAVPYGYSVLQIQYAGLEGGRIGLDWARLNPMQDFKPNRSGEITRKDSRTSELRVLTEDEKTVFFLTRRNPSWENPYGDALLSRLYWPWFFRHNGWSFWMKLLERFGDPLLIGKGPEPQDIVDALHELGFDSVVAVGNNDELDAFHATGKDSFETLEIAVTKRIQKLVLGQTLTSDVGSSGSYAAAKVHNDVRMDKRNSDIRLITPTIQRVIDALWALNGFSGDSPTFIMDDGNGLQMARAERDANLVKSGVLKLTEDYLLRVYDYEAGDFEIPQASPQGQGALGAGTGLMLSAQAPLTRAQQRIEDLGDGLLESTELPIPADKIQAAIKAASSPEDLDRRLAKLAVDANPAAYREMLEKALFAADVMGYQAAEARES